MSRADLFVVCKNPECGAEVSPYVTECPYCGTRLQKRAPKLDKGLQPARRLRRMPAPSLGRLRPGEIPGIRADRPPYFTGAIIIATAILWIATRAGWRFWRDAFRVSFTRRRRVRWWRSAAILICSHATAKRSLRNSNPARNFSAHECFCGITRTTNRRDFSRMGHDWRTGGHHRSTHTRGGFARH